MATPSNQFNISKRVQVWLRQTLDISFVKEGATYSGDGTKDSNEYTFAPIANAVFSLYQCSKYGEEGHVHSTKVGAGTCWGDKPRSISNSLSVTGVVDFKELVDGDYAIVETMAPAKYKLADASNMWVIHVDTDHKRMRSLSASGWNGLMGTKAADGTLIPLDGTETNINHQVVLRNMPQ